MEERGTNGYIPGSANSLPGLLLQHRPQEGVALSSLWACALLVLVVSTPSALGRLWPYPKTQGSERAFRGLGV